MPDVGQRAVSCASAGRELNNLFTTGACWETAGGSVSETKQLLGIRRVSFLSTNLLLLPLSQFSLDRAVKRKGRGCAIESVSKLLRERQMGESETETGRER